MVTQIHIKPYFAVSKQNFQFSKAEFGFAIYMCFCEGNILSLDGVSYTYKSFDFAEVELQKLKISQLKRFMRKAKRLLNSAKLNLASPNAK